MHWDERWEAWTPGEGSRRDVCEGRDPCQGRTRGLDSREFLARMGCSAEMVDASMEALAGVRGILLRHTYP